MHKTALDKQTLPIILQVLMAFGLVPPFGEGVLFKMNTTKSSLQLFKLTPCHNVKFI